MNLHNLVELSKRVQSIGESCSDLFLDEIEQLKKKHGIDTPQHLAEVFTKLDEADRLLSIGFVGRVKAGKSSLLNALFFKGESVLPKAATPMTAALTTLTYGEKFAAKVEFFAEEDLHRIHELHEQYIQQLNVKIEQHYGDIEKRRKARSNTPIDEADLRNMARRQALNEMKRMESLAAAHEQAELMTLSGIDPSELPQSKHLEATNEKELKDQLNDFVGAKGRYMPFTKIVHVYMPLEALRDICVIDTPGTNDPVVSREARTVALLKTCDVVFVVSPAGQFLNEDDLTLLSRITLKEGVQELALVASQVDSQLHDSEKRATLDGALDNVRSKLSSQARRNLGDLKLSNPEGAAIFGALLNSVETGLLHSAGICMTLEQQFDAPGNWGDEEKTAWENLVESYPDYFTFDNSERSRVGLRKLSNILNIRKKLSEVRSRKDVITKNKIDNLCTIKRKSLENFRSGLALLVNDKIIQINSSNANELHKQLKVLNSQNLNLQQELGLSYEECMQQYKMDIRSKLEGKAQEHLREVNSKNSDIHKRDDKEIIREKDGAFNWLARKLWEGGNEIRIEKVSSVMTAHVVTNLNGFISKMQTLLNDETQLVRRKLDNKLGAELTPIVKKVLDENCNPDLISKAIASVVNSLNTGPFVLGIQLPSKICGRGTLKGSAAVEFMEEAESFVAELEQNTIEKIKQFISDLERDIPKNVTDIFVASLASQIQKLETQLKDADQNVHRLKKCYSDLTKVSLQ